MIRAAIPAFLLALVTVLTGCASSSSTGSTLSRGSPAAPVGDIWVERSEGGCQHVQSRGLCPAKFQDWVLRNKMTFAPDGSDVACIYGNETQEAALLTAYFTDIGDTDIVSYGQRAAQVAWSRLQVGVDEEASMACRLGVALSTAGESLSDEKTSQKPVAIDADQTPCWVFSNNEMVSLVGARKYGSWAFKLRISRMLKADMEPSSIGGDFAEFLYLQKGSSSFTAPES